MKASELISELSKQIQANGDRNVQIKETDSFTMGSDIKSVYLESAFDEKENEGENSIIIEG